MTENGGPLQGLVVVDLSTTLASAYASLVYADFGAEVIQVEPPGGSRLREQPSWPFWLRGKKSIELDLHDPADQDVARTLCLGADVVIEAFRPGTTDRLGLGDADLRADNPGLVYTSITGFGPEGPFAQLKAYEAVVMAKTGSMYGANRSGRPGPVVMNVPGATMAGALLAVQGSLLAIHERATSGHGQHVHASMMQGMLAQDPWTYFGPVLARLYPDAFSGMGQAAAPGRPIPTSWLGFGLLNGYTADGRWLQFAHATAKQFHAFVDELGLAWTRDDPELAGAPDHEDATVRERWWELMLEAIASRTMLEWQDVFDRNSDVFGEVYLSGTELFDHPQIVHDGNVAELDLPGVGHVREMGVLVQMAATPGSPLGAPPQVGEHGEELRARPRRAVPVPEGSPSDRPPLDGLLVVDLGTFYAGPFGSAMLADLGARVIKVEPLAGDPIRFIMPVPEWGSVRVTQGKESLAVDAYSEEGRAIVAELVRRADVVLHSYRGGVAARMGLDAESMLALNPDLVYHHGQGYGLNGPYCRRSAYAPTIAAGSGFAARSGGGGRQGVALTLEETKDESSFLAGAQAGHPDGFAALGAGAAMALGLVARDLGHGGQATMTSMLNTMGHVLAQGLVEIDGEAAAPSTDPAMLGYSALYRLYEAADGWVVLCVTDEREWSSLLRSLGRDSGLADDPRFATVAARATHDGELAELLSTVFLTRPAGAWEKALVGAEVACVEVLPNMGGLASGLMSPGGVAEQHAMMTTVEHPLFGEVPRTRALVSFSRSGQTLGSSCLVGQHTDAILAELGYDADRIKELRAAAIVG